MPNKNAQIGTAVERLFKNSIRNRDDVHRILKDYFKIEGSFATSYLTGADAGKSDVILKFADGRTLSANIKAFKAGFNQITRSRISHFCDRFGIQSLRPVFEEGALRVAKKSGRFILETDEQIVKSTLSPIAHKIVQVSIAGPENPELLVLFDRLQNRMLLYDLRKLLDDIDYEVSFSKRGIIGLGHFFTIQRKGGNGVHSMHIAKDSLDHPGNGLQVKMNVRKFVNSYIPLVEYTP